MMTPRPKYLVGNLAIAALYVVTGSFALSLHAIGGVATLPSR